MPDEPFHMPAYCPTCKLTFYSGFSFGGRRTLLKGNKTQCPNCHRSVALPDGVFDFIDGMMKVSESGSGREELAKMAGILTAARTHQATPEQIKTEIAAAGPGFESLIRFVPNDSVALATWILVVIACIQILLGEKPSVTNIDQRVTVQQTPNANPAVAPGRNDSCPCGSGKKFKKCHGAAKQ